MAQLHGNMYQLENRVHCLSFHSDELNRWVCDRMERVTAQLSYTQAETARAKGRLESCILAVNIASDRQEEAKVSYNKSVDDVARATSAKEVTNRQSNTWYALSVAGRGIGALGTVGLCFALGPAGLGLAATLAEATGIAMLANMGSTAHVLMVSAGVVNEFNNGIKDDKRAAETSRQLAQQRLQDALTNMEARKQLYNNEMAALQAARADTTNRELELRNIHSLCDAVRQEQGYVFRLSESTKRANVLVQSIRGNVETAMLWMETNEYVELAGIFWDMENTMSQLEACCGAHQLTH